MRGGEKVLQELCILFPQADIYTLFFVPENISPEIRKHRVKASWLQRLPGSVRYYRYLLPLFPITIGMWRLKGYDLVISVSHCVAKGAVVPPLTPHICYCLTPMRYIWNHFESYFGKNSSPPPVRLGMKLLRPILQQWDRFTVKRVSEFIAISTEVQRRILRYYRRHASIIHPPVDTDFFRLPQTDEREDYYLIVSALVPYKNIGLAISAFNINKRRLKIVGVGPEEERLRKMATSKSIEFLGWVSQRELLTLYQRAKALIFPGEEDFGIAMVEALACGTPVIALGRGGALDIVRPEVNGLLFRHPDPDALNEAIFSLERTRFIRTALRESSLPFSKHNFRKKITNFIKEIINKNASA